MHALAFYLTNVPQILAASVTATFTMLQEVVASKHEQSLLYSHAQFGL